MDEISTPGGRIGHPPSQARCRARHWGGAVLGSRVRIERGEWIVRSHHDL